MERDSFILYTEQKDVIDKLTDEQAGKLIKAIYEYAKTDKMPALDELLDIVIIPFKQNLDRNTEKWNEIKQKRSEAGKIGAEIKKQKQAKQANANFVESKEANQAVNVNVNANVNDNVNVSSDDDINIAADEKKIIDFWNNNIGTMTQFQLEVIEGYLNEFSAEMIVLAIQRAIKSRCKNFEIC